MATVKETDKSVKTPKDSPKEASKKSLDLALSAINREFGEGTLMKMGERSHKPVDVISTGSVAIDLALGVGGLPRGRICEIYGRSPREKPPFAFPSSPKRNAAGAMPFLSMLSTRSIPVMPARLALIWTA